MIEGENRDILSDDILHRSNVQNRSPGIRAAQGSVPEECMEYHGFRGRRNRVS